MIIDNTMPNSSAYQNPLILNPGTITPVSQIRNALITSVNNPSVKILIGSVNKISTGLIKVLSKPSTRATMSAVKKPPTCTPGSTYAAINIAKALIIQLISMAIGLRW